jgi:hypothetical protein
MSAAALPNGHYPLDPSVPTTAAPGSPEKIAILAARVAKGLSAFDDGDETKPGPIVDKKPRRPANTIATPRQKTRPKAAMVEPVLSKSTVTVPTVIPEPGAVAKPSALELARELVTMLAQDADLLPLAARLARKLEPCRHSVDFSSVRWYGTTYSFTAGQAAAARVLWQAWRNGTPDVRQETLMESVGGKSQRMACLFSDHPAWGALIVHGGSKGSYCLSEHEQRTKIEDGDA